MHEPPEFPKFRPGLTASIDGEDARFIYLRDQLRIGGQPIRLTRRQFAWVRLIDGEKSLRDLQFEATALCGGELQPLKDLRDLIARFDRALFLDSPRLHDYLSRPEREPSCVGCYPREPDAIRSFLRKLFVGDGGPGLPGEPGCRIAREGCLRAALVPHIDYVRGNITYGWGFKEVAERTNASLFVIVGTSHYSPNRYTLTRKNFKTPLGVVETDQGYVDRIAAHYGDGLFDDPFAHLPEHSIELEVLLLQFLYEGKRPIRIVPLLVGPFADCVADKRNPNEKEDIARMIAALRQAETEAGESVCYIISGDLAHIGPKFDDPEPVSEAQLEHSLQQDLMLMELAEAVDDAGYFRLIAEEDDARRICGLPPTYTTLQAAKPAAGKLLHQGVYVHPQGFESVSFASMAFS